MDHDEVRRRFDALKAKHGVGDAVASGPGARLDGTAQPTALVLTGDSLKRKVAAKKGRTRLNTKNLLRLFKASEEIAQEDAFSADTIGYMTRVLIQTNLPYREPGDVVAWNRRNGDFLLQITPGVTLPDRNNESRRLGIPFGTYPRLVVSWVTTEALRTDNPELFLGHSLADFMRRIDIQCTGGRNGTVGRLRDQMTRLVSSTIAWTYREGAAELKAGIRPFEGLFTFWDPKSPNQTSIWPSKLVLNTRLFEDMRRHSVPLDMRVMRELARQRSSLGMDLYSWLTYRQHALQKTGKPVFVPWPSLAQQFGADYKLLRNFRRDFRPTLEVVRSMYPDCNATMMERGLIIRPGRPHVAVRPLKPRKVEAVALPPATEVGSDDGPVLSKAADPSTSTPGYASDLPK